MKKLFCLATLLVFLASCSPDSDSPAIPNPMATPPSEPSGIVPLKIISSSTSIIGIMRDTTYYHYNGNKLTDYINGTSITKYIYNGDFITQLDFCNALSGYVYSSLFFEYDGSGRLSKSTRNHLNQDNLTLRSTFQYNSNGTVTSLIYSKDDFTSETLSSTAIYTNGTNNEVASVQTTAVGGNAQTTFYTYDAMNNTFKNITGFDKLGVINQGINFNIESTIVPGHPLVNDVYTYNQNSYPQTRTHYSDGISNFSDEYIYNQ